MNKETIEKTLQEAFPGAQFQVEVKNMTTISTYQVINIRTDLVKSITKKLPGHQILISEHKEMKAQASINRSVVDMIHSLFSCASVIVTIISMEGVAV